MTYIGATDFLIEVQKGNVPGHSIIHKFGRNDAVANATWEIISELGGATAFLAAATTVRIKAGGNAADTAAGAGAREVTVRGVDDNLAEISEAIATAGASASSNTTASFWRVHRAWVSSAGTYATPYNTAAIVIENSGGGTDLIQVGAEEGQSEAAVYTIPTGKTGYFLGAHIQVDSGKAADLRMFQRRTFNDVTAPVTSRRLVIHLDGVLGVEPFSPRSPIVFPALTDLWWEAEGAGAQTEVSVDFELLLVDD